MNTTTNDTQADKPAFRFHPKLWLCAAMLFAFPLLGMVMGQAKWGAEDFAAMALLLGVLCLAIEGAVHFLDTPRWRIAMILLAVLMFLTIWAHLAVGIFD